MYKKAINEMDLQLISAVNNVKEAQTKLVAFINECIDRDRSLIKVTEKIFDLEDNLANSISDLEKIVSIRNNA